MGVHEGGELNTSTVVWQLRALGLQEGSLVLVHTSFKNVGPLDGGPDAVIDALIETIGPEGTLVMPSWIGDDDASFDPSSTPVNDHLGIVADTFWRRQGVLRTNHQSAMAAIGPHAAFITSAPLILPPHAEDSGIARVNELDGWVLLLGCDHDSNTTVHLGELRGGAPYFQVNEITVVVDGRPKKIFYGENDSCCLGFRQVGSWLAARGLQREGTVGHGHAKLMRSRDVVDTVAEELRDDPCRFLHPRGSGCEECDETWVSVVGTRRMVVENV
jgi:aminoglycoside 3-N-acetyltransferase